MKKYKALACASAFSLCGLISFAVGSEALAKSNAVIGGSIENKKNNTIEIDCEVISVDESNSAQNKQTTSEEIDNGLFTRRPKVGETRTHAYKEDPQHSIPGRGTDAVDKHLFPVRVSTERYTAISGPNGEKLAAWLPLIDGKTEISQGHVKVSLHHLDEGKKVTYKIGLIGISDKDSFYEHKVLQSNKPFNRGLNEEKYFERVIEKFNALPESGKFYANGKGIGVYVPGDVKLNWMGTKELETMKDNLQKANAMRKEGNIKGAQALMAKIPNETQIKEIMKKAPTYQEAKEIMQKELSKTDYFWTEGSSWKTQSPLNNGTYPTDRSFQSIEAALLAVKQRNPIMIDKNDQRDEKSSPF